MGRIPGAKERPRVLRRPTLRGQSPRRAIRGELILLVVVCVPLAAMLLAGAASGRLALSLQIGLPAAASAIAAGILVPLHLRRGLARSFAALARSMDEVGRDHDYRRTAEAAADDEAGELARGFNRMLGEIRARDEAVAARLAGLESELAEARAAVAAEQPAPRRRLAVVDDILDASAIETGVLQRVPTDVAELARDVSRLFWDSAAAKGLDLAAYVDPATPRLVEGDPARLRQMIAVLVDNAIRRTEAGGVLIEIEPASTDSLRFSIRDTGAGVPREQLGGLFGGGAGPELAACKRLAEAMGGRLQVASEVGRGSTFAFRIPVKTVEPARAWPGAPRRGAVAAVRHGGASTRRALARYLARSGYRVVGADGTAEAELTISAAAMSPREPTGRPTVCLAPFGDPAPQDLLRLGAVQALLAQPFGRGEIEALLRRVEAGAPLHEEAGAAEAVRPAAEAPGGKSGFVAGVRGLYRINAPGCVAEIAEAVESQDAAAAAGAAQALKSMSLEIGATDVARRAADMEALARDGRAPTQAEALDLTTALTGALQALEGRSARTTRAGPSPALPPSRPVTPESQALLDDLEAALGTDQLSLVYQPQFDRDGREILGVEALLRWTHPARGPISPAMFIPVVEEHGRIDRLTTWVMERALRETADLQGLQIAFNASALEFVDAGIADRIRELVNRIGFDPSRLEVEITETAILANEEQVRTNMSSLRRMGVKIALDDFGAGYSSLGHLRRYPFDKLKIDREFVVDCTRDIQSATVVHAVVSIGRALGMKVVAEGVETEQQRQFLKIAGVHAVQGYLFGKPMPIEVLKEALAAEAHRARA